MLRKLIIGLCVILVSGLFFTNVYISMVDAHSWASDMPQSVYTEREYFKTVNPGDFFRLFAPVMQVLLLLLIIACWKMGSNMRWLCITAFLTGLGIDVFTFTYFYPRNDIMLHETNVFLIRKAVNEWRFMDHFRSAICGINIIVCFVIQSKIYNNSIIVKK